jgi:hypothetical protein
MSGKASVILMSISRPKFDKNGIYIIFVHPVSHPPGKSISTNLHFNSDHLLAGISVHPQLTDFK